MRILIGAETARCCAGEFAIIEIDRVRVKGKREAETIFTLLGGRDVAQQAGFASFQSRFQIMLQSYRGRDWPRAIGHLERCRSMAGESGLGKLLDLYASRIAGFAETPPPADWDGVFQAWAASPAQPAAGST